MKSRSVKRGICITQWCIYAASGQLCISFAGDVCKLYRSPAKVSVSYSRTNCFADGLYSLFYVYVHIWIVYLKAHRFEREFGVNSAASVQYILHHLWYVSHSALFAKEMPRSFVINYFIHAYHFYGFAVFSGGFSIERVMYLQELYAAVCADGMYATSFNLYAQDTQRFPFNNYTSL